MNQSRRSKLIYGEMVCRICSDLLKEPKMLSCAHSFCKECLISLQETSCKSPTTGLQYQMDSENCWEEDNYSNRIECPLCLQTTLLPGECSIENLHAHTQLDKMVASLSPEEKQGVREKLGYQQKIVSNIAEGIYNPESCKLHKKLHEFFCTDCSIMACMDCVSDTHAIHQCTEIPTLLVENFSQLQCLVQPACEFVSRADVSLRKLSQDYDSIESNRNVCKEAIFDVFKKLHTAIDEREKLLLNRVDNYIDQKLLQVAHQKKTLTEVQDQLYESIKEVQQLLDSSLLDISFLTEKQRLLDDVDVQEQSILDIENFVSSSMFSSTYVGFQDDNTKAIKRNIDMLITLCEFYPDADTGYYSSRVIPVDKEEPLYVTTESTTKFSTSIPEEDDDDTIFTEVFEPVTHKASHPRPCVKRSQSTPNASMKEKWLMKKINNETVPSVPIRFDSLLSPTPIITPRRVFNKLTASKTEAVYPCGICMGENNSFIISDVKNHCLRIIASNGKFIGAIGKEGKGSGQFEEPSAVTVNEKTQIFVCQRENPRIQKLTSGGKFVQKFGHKSLRGSSLGEPWGIVMGLNKKLYVTDWDKSCIHIFDSNGRYDSSIGNDNSILGESLKFPAGITIDSNGSLIVADRGNHCVWILKSDGSILMRIGTKGHGPGELFLPHGVAIHPNGSIIVSETGNNRISVFSPSGKFLNYFGQKGSEPGMFEYPRHICMTPKGELVVADELNQRLQLFSITI